MKYNFLSVLTVIPDPWLNEKERYESSVTTEIYKQIKIVSRKTALKLSNDILTKAEEERFKLYGF
ncbi:MAG: hypothetical protein KatS3mg002_0390 [Candidatus Woesearchaeota archaeon]|nr:MAG: hypothetical protein KatS3mg002_0390 [Candidatus Woesearchaeota archaeon]